ncbi:MAG TPA: alpha-amylase family glycosyl hydrolase [Verrucomicrobiae bacterium]|nr:alpha-amylase family glycosyl hydrolase [Verrucomicrobiae bacterium]
MTVDAFVPHRRSAFRGAIWFALLLGLLPPTARRASAEAMLQLFNLSWNEVATKIPEIAEAGYTSLWLPPPTKANSSYSVGYDVFDPFDLGDKNQRGTTATRYGTKEELQHLVALAHRFGLRVYFDNIMNHRGADVPGYNAFVPTNLYPGTVPADFHLRSISGGFFRNASNIRDYGSTWQVQNLSLLGLVDIAHESPNANFGPSEGSTAPKPVFVRHPDNPEYYDFNSNGVRVGFGNVTAADLAANPNQYREDINALLLRSVRYLFDQTKCDGLRLDAVKHVPSYFFGQQSGPNRDESFAGYLGQAQLQFNLTHGFEDTNQRNSNFDTELTRNDALLFGEHLGEPPGFGEYIDAGMRLLDNPLRNNLNNILGNPAASLAGYEQRDAGGFSAGVRVMHAQSHDNDFVVHRELHNAYYFLREGIPLIYSDGYNEADGNPPFPRHANAPYLGQFGDNKMPDLAYLHHQLARGGTRPRWGDSDVVAFERYDYRDPGTAADQTVVLFAMNDNYGNPGDINFDDGVAQDNIGMPSANCYQSIDNSRGVGLVVGFLPGSLLRQLADSPGDSRACPEILVRLATNIRLEAQNSANDASPVNRKVYVGGQTLAPGGGAIEFKIPSGGYVCYAYQWPEASRVDNALTNAAGVVTNSDVIVILQNGRVVPRLVLYRKDGPDGDGNFNPLYPFKMRGSVDIDGSVVAGQNFSNRTYSISVPVITNAGPMDILARTDGSTLNTLLKLDGGIDLNSQMGLGATNAFPSGLADLRDNRPGTATDSYLGYEQMQFRSRFGAEKFAARNTARCTVRSLGAETYSYTVGSAVVTNRVNGDGFGNDYTSETCEWAFHDAAASTTMAVSNDVPQRSSTLTASPVDLYVKVGYEFDISRCRVYYTIDGSNPEGAYGVGHGTTQVASGSFVDGDEADGAIDWWKATLPAQPNGTTVKYKIALHKRSSATTTVNPIADFADAKHYALTEFAITNWNPGTAQVWLHNNLNTNHIATGLAEGFHILRARAFLPRDGKSGVFNTFLQTFYYDTQPPDGAIAFPPAASTLRSVDYGCVVRADETVTEIEYNILDNDPNNDDATTGFANGNGLTNGVPVFVRAALVTPTALLNAQFPNFLREFRFTYFAVPRSGNATITVRLKELSTDAFPDHFRTLTRTVACAAPAQTLQIAFPSFDGQIINLPQDGAYSIVTRFTDTLTADVNLFSIFIDGAFQERTNGNGPTYAFNDQTPGDGKNEFRFDWRGMNAGQHLIEVHYTGDGLALEATRLARITLTGVADTDGDGLPDFWETQNGLSTTNSIGLDGADGDPDGDGFSNLQEYLAGTDPWDGGSLLKIIDLAGTGRVIIWNSIPGRNYQVFATTNVNAAFTARSGTLTAFTSPMSFTNPAPVRAREFYRVLVFP